MPCSEQRHGPSAQELNANFVPKLLPCSASAWPVAGSGRSCALPFIYLEIGYRPGGVEGPVRGHVAERGVAPTLANAGSAACKLEPRSRGKFAQQVQDALCLPLWRLLEKKAKWGKSAKKGCGRCWDPEGVCRAFAPSSRCF